MPSKAVVVSIAVIVGLVFIGLAPRFTVDLAGELPAFFAGILKAGSVKLHILITGSAP